MPALAGGFAKNAAAGGGLDGLLGALAGGRHAGYLDDLASLAQPSTTADGNGILGHVLGSKDVSRQVAMQAAASSGVGADILKKMLPVVAAMMMGAMAKRAGGHAAAPGGLPGGLGGGLSLPGGLGANVGGAPGGGLLDMLAPMLDRDRGELGRRRRGRHARQDARRPLTPPPFAMRRDAATTIGRMSRMLHLNQFTVGRAALVACLTLGLSPRIFAQGPSALTDPGGTAATRDEVAVLRDEVADLRQQLLALAAEMRARCVAARRRW